MENASGRMQRAIRGGWMSCGGGVVCVERGVQERDCWSVMAMMRCERRVVRVCDSVAMNAVQCRVAVCQSAACGAVHGVPGQATGYGVRVVWCVDWAWWTWFSTVPVDHGLSQQAARRRTRRRTPPPFAAVPGSHYPSIAAIPGAGLC